jgi:hypothetical protein
MSTFGLERALAFRCVVGIHDADLTGKASLGRIALNDPAK